MSSSHSRLVRMVTDCSGLTAIEYAAVASVLVVMIVSSIGFVAAQLSAAFGTVIALF